MCDFNKTCIGNIDALTVAMGKSPCFHDANVLTSVQTANSCEVTVHMFQMTSEINAKGYYVCVNHHLVTLCMTDVRESTLPDPYEGDCLGELGAEFDGELVRVEFGSIMSSGGHVLCGKATVSSIVPCDEDGRTNDERSEP